MWKNVLGQERAKENLKRIFQSGKIPHSFIFYGSEGVGKDAAAIEFAKLLNCDNPINGNEACDACQSCIEIGELKSSLLKYIIALPSGKNDSDEDSNPLEKLDKEDYSNYLNEIDCKRINKYYSISLPRANTIRISSIRQMIKDIYLTGKSGKKKIFIISKSDKMNINSANSLLKILEEPPRDSVLILTTSKITSHLPTIIGRCQKIKFDNLKKSVILGYLKESENSLSNDEAEFYSELSDGSISKCDDILNNNFLELRETVVNLLSALLSGKYVNLGAEIDSVVSKKDKDIVKQFLMLLILWFRDLIYVSNDVRNLIINKDKIDRLIKFDQNFISDNYKIIKLIEEAVKDVESNVFPELLLFNLSINILKNIRRKN